MSPIFKQAQLIAAAVLIAVILALTVSVYWQHNKIGALETKTATATSDIAALKVRTDGLERVRKTQEKTNADLTKASDLHPESADSVVPDDVVCVLRHTCSP